EVAEEERGGEHGAHQRHEHHGVLGHHAGIELLHAGQRSVLEDLRVEQRRLLARMYAHQNTCPEAPAKCSTMFESPRAGKKVNAPTMRITATRRPTNSVPLVGKVPGPAGTVFLPAIEPAIASAGRIIMKRPTSMAM